MRVIEPAAAARAAVAAHPERPATALMYDAPDVRLVVFRVGSGQAVAAHTSPSAVMLYVVAGAGTVSGAEGEREVRAGQVVAYEPNEPHSMRATDQELVLLAAITPRPGGR